MNICRKFTTIIVSGLFLFSCKSRMYVYDPQKKYEPAQLREDFLVLERTLKKYHPSLYWFTSQPVLQQHFSATLQSLDDSLTETAFRKKIAATLVHIRCGHTVARPSRQYQHYMKNRNATTIFPLALKVWPDTAVVVGAVDSSLERGTIITSINNKSVNEIADSIKSYISTDGFADILKYQTLSFNFGSYYQYLFGSDSLYHIKYVDSIGSIKDTTLTSVKLPDSLKTNNNAAIRNKSNKLQKPLQIDTSTRTAILKVVSFSQPRLKRYFRQYFKEIADKNVSSLILDLRMNSGGNIMHSTDLTQYLINKPFTVADTIIAYNRNFSKKDHIHPRFIYWLSMHLSGKRKKDNRIHFNYFEKHQFKPKSKFHFDGDIYVLTSGYTFSAATLVTHYLKGQNNVRIIGEETGGGAAGNSSMHLTNITLPNTGIRVVLPLYRIVLNQKETIPGRGIMPDVEVKPTVVSIRKGVDVKMEKAKELIRNKANQLQMK